MSKRLIFDVVILLFVVASITFTYFERKEVVVLYVGGAVVALWLALKLLAARWGRK